MNFVLQLKLHQRRKVNFKLSNEITKTHFRGAKKDVPLRGLNFGVPNLYQGLEHQTLNSISCNFDFEFVKRKENNYRRNYILSH